MKKVYSLLLLLFFYGAVQAQSDRFMAAMQQKVAAFDTTFSVNGLTALANDFERIADAEKTQWLPYYYAALAQVNGGMMMTGGNMNGGDASKTDQAFHLSGLLHCHKKSAEQRIHGLFPGSMPV